MNEKQFIKLLKGELTPINEKLKDLKPIKDKLIEHDKQLEGIAKHILSFDERVDKRFNAIADTSDEILDAVDQYTKSTEDLKDDFTVYKFQLNKLKIEDSLKESRIKKLEKKIKTI